MWKIPLFDLAYDHKEQEAVNQILKSKWLSSGPETAAFESEFSAYIGQEAHSIAVTNCTAALYMALHLHGIGPGDEVIIPALTFVADLNVVQLTRATPVLADCSSLENWNISRKTIQPCISPKTKAVIIVHFAGVPCHMQPIMELCAENNLILIEDCAHAPGSTYHGQPCGSFGHVACFSFFSNKNLSTGEGGMFVTRDENLADKARLLRNHGMTSMAVGRDQEKGFSYNVIMPGFNYRTDELHSALGRVQLTKLKDNNQKRGVHHKNYVEHLSNIDEISIPFLSMDDNYQVSYHIFPILLARPDLRQAFIAYLKENGIQTSIHYPPMDGFTYYEDSIKTPQIAADISSRTVTLPLYSDLKCEDIKYIVYTIKSFFSGKKDKV